MTIQQVQGGAIVATGQGITVYQALAVKQGLKACKIGMRVNRAYTPTNLMRMVQQITGQKHKLRDYDGAIASVETWISGEREKYHVGAHFESCYAGCSVEHGPDGMVKVHLPEDGVTLEFKPTDGCPALLPWRAYVNQNGDKLEIMQGPESEH